MNANAQREWLRANHVLQRYTKHGEALRNLVNRELFASNLKS